jgi:hypothetical protein
MRRRLGENSLSQPEQVDVSEFRSQRERGRILIRHWTGTGRQAHYYHSYLDSTAITIIESRVRVSFPFANSGTATRDPLPSQ